MSHNQDVQLDQEYMTDKVMCPLCNGHQLIDTDLSNAFGMGLNATADMKNPYDFRLEHRKFLNFTIGRRTQSMETLVAMFKRLKL